MPTEEWDYREIQIVEAGSEFDPTVQQDADVPKTEEKD